jgi:hypothetical protein
MALNNQEPAMWSPVGVSDTSDGGNVFAGAMTALSNLVPDPSTANVFVPRPAAELLTDFSGSGISNPGFISALKVSGNIAYGMIATSSPSGKDVPFIYNLDTDTFTAIAGVTGGNTPDSVSDTGTWVPPTIAIIGTTVAITHPGFPSISPVGFIDISTPSAPVWSSADLATNGLPDVPTAVVEFASRAYYAVGNTSYYSDVLDATKRSKAAQSITHGDDSDIKGYGTMPIRSTNTGNVETLFVFKPKSLFQVTGDEALSTLLNAEVSTGIGTESPLSISSTPSGLMFISQHGLRNISVGGEVSPVVGADGAGVSIPFINSVETTRVSAAFNINTIRIGTQNSSIPTLPFQDWWYNTDKGAWTGPHSFPASLVEPWEGTFVITPQGINGQLWKSDIVPLDSSSYIENGESLEFLYQTALLPDPPTMNEATVIETTVALQFSKVGGTINFFGQDEDAQLLDNTSKTITVTASVWDTTAWGTSQWGGNVTNYQRIRVPWTKPLVFSQASFGATGLAVNGFKIGAWSNRYQHLGYMTTR